MLSAAIAFTANAAIARVIVEAVAVVGDCAASLDTITLNVDIIIIIFAVVIVIIINTVIVVDVINSVVVAVATAVFGGV